MLTRSELTADRYLRHNQFESSLSCFESFQDRSIHMLDSRAGVVREGQGGGGSAHRIGMATAVGNLLGIAETMLRQDPELAREYLVEALSLINCECSRDKTFNRRPQGGLAGWQISRIKEYIDDRLDAAIKSRELARVVNLSVSHFSRAFKQSFGDTPSAYVARRRMDRARELMVTSDTALSQIALNCGLCDQSHFTRMFRRLVGMSPRKWRQQYSRGPNADSSRQPATV
jgi:AraC-like DNA-binding protein